MPELLTRVEAAKLKGPIVYGLCATDGQIFYVGKTVAPAKRFYQHTQSRFANSNPRLRERLRLIGPKGIRIIVLSQSPADLNSEERRFIAAYPDALNIIKSGHWSWSAQSTSRPWAAGAGILSPTAVALRRMSVDRKRVCRAYLLKLSEAERCALEIDLFREMPPFAQRRCERWLSLVFDKMSVALNVPLAHENCFLPAT